MSHTSHALAWDQAEDEPGPAPLTVIGGDIEDDAEEAPTVVGTDLAALGMAHLALVTPRWEQPEGIGDADTAPEARAPLTSELSDPFDPTRTFPPDDEGQVVDAREPREPAREASGAPAVATPQAGPSSAEAIRPPARDVALAAVIAACALGLLGAGFWLVWAA